MTLGPARSLTLAGGRLPYTPSPAGHPAGFRLFMATRERSPYRKTVEEISRQEKGASHDLREQLPNPGGNRSSARKTARHGSICRPPRGLPTSPPAPSHRRGTPHVVPGTFTRRALRVRVRLLSTTKFARSHPRSSASHDLSRPERAKPIPGSCHRSLVRGVHPGPGPRRVHPRTVVSNVNRR
jgi:hypothetical protein